MALALVAGIIGLIFLAVTIWFVVAYIRVRETSIFIPIGLGLLVASWYFWVAYGAYNGLISPYYIECCCK